MLSSIDIYEIRDINEIILDYKKDIEYAEHIKKIKNKLFIEMKYKIYFKNKYYLKNNLFFKSRIPNDISGFIKLIDKKLLLPIINTKFKEILTKNNIEIIMTDIIFYFKGYLILFHDMHKKNKDILTFDVLNLINYIKLFNDNSEILSE